MRKLLAVLLALGSLSAAANEICGKIGSVTIRAGHSTTLKFRNDDKPYHNYDSNIGSALVAAKAGDLTVCLKNTVNSNTRFVTVEIKD